MVPQQQRRRRRRAAITRTTERRLVVARGAGGFGFTIAGQRPCVVSAVAAGGPAERAGLRAGDALLAVDGANVARAPHASVARLVAGAPGAISLSVSPRDAPPTDTEDTEPDERARTRRRHPPPRRRLQPAMHHPGCHVAPSSSGVNEILQNLSRAQLTSNHVARLECRAVVAYLGTIETPQVTSNAAPSNVRTAVRKLRQERRSAAPVLLSVLPNSLILRRPSGQVLAQYQRERIVFAGCGSDADRRYFGLVTSAEMTETEASHSCHVFAVDPRMAEHEAHIARAREFQIACTRDPVAERCLEFPPSAEYVVGVIRGMYSLPAEDCSSPNLQQISKLALKSDSPAMGNFSRCNRAVQAFRVPRDRRPCRQEDVRIEPPDFIANSPQPSNHSEITTTSSNSDSGIGFHNDGRNIADRILVVEFAGAQPPPNRFRQEMPRRPLGLVGCSSFDADGLFLSNTTPVVDGFGGQGRPLNMDDVILNANDMQTVRHLSPRNEDDTYNYNNIYGNIPSTSRQYPNGAIYDQVYTENEAHHYEFIPQQLDMDLEIDQVAETFNSVEIYEESRRGPPDWHSNESVENSTVISAGTSKASMDTVSVYSSRSHEEARPALRKHLQASLDDMLMLGLRDPPKEKDDDNFVHPATVKCKVRKSMKPLNILSKTKNILSGKDKEKKEARRRAISASAGDVAAAGSDGTELPAAASEPDLRDTQLEIDFGHCCKDKQLKLFEKWEDFQKNGTRIMEEDINIGAGFKEMFKADNENERDFALCSALPNKIKPTAKVLNSDKKRLKKVSMAESRQAFITHVDNYADVREELQNRHNSFNKRGLTCQPFIICVGSYEAFYVVFDDIMYKFDSLPKAVDICFKSFMVLNLAYPKECQQSEQSSPFRRWTTGSGATSSYRHHDHRNMYNKQMSEGSSPVSGGGCGSSSVARWSLGLEQLLADPGGTAAFTHFLAKEFASENLRFWRACEVYATVEDGARRAALAHEIWARHLDEKAPEPVNVDAAARRAAALALYQEPPPQDLFQQAQKQIFNVMKFDSYQRFLRSAEHAECARADLRGLPAPYPPAPDPATPSKLKKSASNASERRRSGGSSLLPWKSRHASRDRLNATEQTQHTDVVKSSSGAPGPQLCRVVLPDGSTSVRGVEPALSVAHLVDKLLHSRNIVCNNYDVILKDTNNKAESVTIDNKSPSTVLGGRQVCVERRCVVRLELGARCVAVRCRADRPLRRVLRPVLQRYNLPPARAVARAGHLVHPDTLMQELDGCRLQLVEAGEVEARAASSAACTERDSDADSSLGIRLDDDQSNSTTSSRSNSTTSAASLSNGVVTTLAGGGTGGGRVRAALRPGPPLHHHPPDFLENLRETQRQRQGKEPPSPSPAACLPPAPAEPRVPPPLPPKPAHRPTPTVV